MLHCTPARCHVVTASVGTLSVIAIMTSCYIYKDASISTAPIISSRALSCDVQAYAFIVQRPPQLDVLVMQRQAHTEKAVQRRK